MASSPPQASSAPRHPPILRRHPIARPASDAPAELTPTVKRLRAARALLWAMVGVMTVVWLFYGGGLES